MTTNQFLVSNTKGKKRVSIVLMMVCIMLTLSGCGIFKKKKVDENATVEELYEIAQESLSDGNWTTAVKELRTLEGKYPYGVYAEQAQLDTIYAYYRNEEPGLAIAAADRFIKLSPTHKSVDYAYYLKGLASFEEDKSTSGFLLGKDDLSDRDPVLTRNALNAFKDVYTLFPNSQYAPSARERVAYLTNTLARHEISIAAYYYSRGAHVAVVNRAKGVVENYPDTETAEQALALLVNSYAAMGLQDLSDDSKRVLALNFPNSEYLSGGGSVAGRSLDKTVSVDGKKGGFFSSFRNLFKRKSTG